MADQNTSKLAQTNFGAAVTAHHLLQAKPLETIPETAKLLNIKPHALRRAVKLGLVPVYRPFNSRIMLKPSEVMMAIEAQKVGGQCDE